MNFNFFHFHFFIMSPSPLLILHDDILISSPHPLSRRFALGMFDDPANNNYAQISVDNISSASHTTLALEAARQSIVLLRNDHNLLPLNPFVDDDDDNDDDNDNDNNNDNDADYDDEQG